MSTVKRVGEVYMWIEQGSSIHIKAVSPHGDPLELNSDDAREISRVLEGLARELDSLDSAGPTS